MLTLDLARTRPRTALPTATASAFNLQQINNGIRHLSPTPFWLLPARFAGHLALTCTATFNSFASIQLNSTATYYVQVVLFFHFLCEGEPEQH